MTDGQEGVDLEHIFVSHRAELRRAAVRIVSLADAADDVIQDAYIKLIGAQTAVVVRDPLSYCFQLVRNMALDHCRRSSLESGLFAKAEEGLHVPAQSGPEQHAISCQNIAIVDAALSKLPERTRKAFELYRLAGLTQRDIALEMALSIGTVNGLIQEALGALMDCRHLLGG
ncbi:MAG: sigma-70 family RNA polymerase sigma factor [Aquabacterium sp.]